MLQYNENEIITINIPSIKYIFEQKERRYYADIWIPSENLIIEVKSEWTYKKDLEKNLKKRDTCLELGYKFQFWICDKKQVLLIL